jgi:hypothetical protein
MTRPAALLLALVIATVMALNSANYYFHHPNYEVGDAAANSLSVDRAKNFAELYGPYSRWGFHHPGPAFFYVQAAGESVFYDLLGIVPAPFNGQALICLFVEVGFFFAALHVFAHWMPGRGRWWFLSLAIVLAALHFGNPTLARAPASLSAAAAFQTTWSAHLVVLIFLCLLTAGASVAAGRGEDLPLLVLAGGCLVHLHVAQPMFVVPCALLGYAGLIGWYATRAAEGAPAGPPGRWSFAALALPWRNHRRAHVVAGSLLLIFVLPLLVDATRGAQSNLAAIFNHLRGYRPEHKSLAKSVFYFLQYGAYATYQAGRSDFGDFTPEGMRRYLAANLPFYVAWSVAFGLSAWVIARQIWRWVGSRTSDPTTRFLAWAGVYLFLSVALTLRWGVIQDGEMFYFNAFFNFAIYFFAALIAAAEVVRLVVAATARWTKTDSGILEPILAALAFILSLAVLISQLRMTDPSWHAHLLTHDGVAQAIVSDRQTPGDTFLDFPQLAWPVAVGIALEVEREGGKFAVPDRWKTMFGPEYPPQVNLQQVAHTAYRKWTLYEAPVTAKDEPAPKTSIPLEDGTSLVLEPLSVIDLDHQGAVSIAFRLNVASPAYEITGWSGAEPWGEWIASKVAVLAFAAAPVNEDVALSLDVSPFLEPARGLTAQRLRVRLNGEPIGPELRLTSTDAPPINLIIPRAFWNKAGAGSGTNAMLELDLPDAISQQDLDFSKPGDTRALALGVRRMSFQAVAAGEAAKASGVVPQEYVWDGRAIPSANVEGVSPDGWAGPEATFPLPRTSSPAPFLQLEGVAVPGLTYPYHFNAQVNGGPVTESTIDQPGPFNILMPLSAGEVRPVGNVRLSFPQTFVPARTEPNSHDDRELSVLLHSVRITSAEQPVLACFREGWYEKETDGKDWWRWGKADGVIELAAERSGTLVITGDARTQVAGNALDVLLDGVRFATVPLPKIEWNPISLPVPVSAGKHLLQIQSRLPGIVPAGDGRVIAFGLKNAAFKLP